MALQSLQIFSLLCYARKLLPLSALKVGAISVRNTIMRKFANFVRLYFPHITTFFNQILGFYYFLKVLFGNVVFLVGICPEQKLVYKENCLLVTIPHKILFKAPMFPEPMKSAVGFELLFWKPLRSRPHESSDSFLFNLNLQPQHFKL